MPLEIIDIVYLTFAAVNIYFATIFFYLYKRNRKLLKSDKQISVFPIVSIIVPAYNEEHTIEKTVKAIQNLDYPKDKLEIVVVDDGSSDGTATVCREIKGIRFFSKVNGGKASALNYGIGKSKGDIVGCVDADCTPKTDALKKMVPFFSEEKVAAVTSSIFVENPKTFMQRLQTIEYIMIVWSRKLLEFLDSIYVTPGPLSIYKKNILKAVGGFDEKNITEDIEIAWRLLYRGYKIRMAIDAEVYTDAPKNFGKWWKQRLRWNIGGLQTTWKYKGAIKFQNALSAFVIPFFFLSYSFSVTGLAVFVVIALRSLYNNILFSFYSLGFGVNPLEYVKPLLLSNMITVFGGIVLLVSLAWVGLSLKVIGKPIGGRMSIPYTLVYLFIYITIFPLNLLQATAKLLTERKIEWKSYSGV